MKPLVALVHFTAPPVIGGVEAVLDEQARLFAAAGYPVRIVTGRGGYSRSLAGRSVRLIPELDSEHPENLAVGAALARGEAAPRFPALRDRLIAELSRALAAVDVAIVHNILTTHFNLPAVAAFHEVASQRPGLQVVVWCHDLSRHARHDVDLKSGFPWDLLRRHRADFIYVAVSAARRRQLAEALACPPELIFCVPNGVDVVGLLGLSQSVQHLIEAGALLAADVILLMPVRITGAKNLELGLSVTASLKAQGVKPRLVITGPPDPHNPDIRTYLSELHGLRRRLNVEAEVTFAYEALAEQTLTTAEIGQLYGLADVVLFPSHREGFGIPVLEAGLLGRPVFTTAVPAVDEIGADQVALIAPHETADQIAARILSCLEDDRGLRLRRRVRQSYSWPVIFERQIEPLIVRAGQRQESQSS